jgi:hypothetical protein
MLPSLLDNPLIVNNLFYPRADRPGGSALPNVTDGSIPVAEGVALGCRLYRHPHAAPVILYFHGNGEIASDYDDFAAEFLRAGASLLVVDYRGYGWSGGRPLVSTLLSDAEKVVPALPGLLGRDDAPLFVMGRSLGSAPAVHLAAAQPAALKGLIIDSGFAHEPSLFRRLNIPDALLQAVPSVFGNAGKMARVDLPLLVIHGQRDTLIPPENGQALYDASPSAHKTIVTIPSAGHNDLLLYGIERYFAALTAFIREFA